MVAEFIDRLKAKHSFSLAKYPESLWNGLDEVQMIHALEDELDELKTALWSSDLNSEHGIKAEAVDVANVAMRIVIEMTRRIGDETRGDLSDFYAPALPEPLPKSD